MSFKKFSRSQTNPPANPSINKPNPSEPNEQQTLSNSSQSAPCTSTANLEPNDGMCQTSYFLYLI